MNIILTSIKRNIRDKNVLIANIFLVLILPYVFSVIFSFDLGHESIDLNIVGDKNSEILKSYVNTLENFDKENEEISLDYKIVSKSEYSEENKIDKDSFNVRIDEKNKEIKIKLSNKLSNGEIAIKNLTEEYFNSISIYESIAKEGNVPQVSKNIIKTSTIIIPKDDSKYENLFSEEYFSVVMLQMAVLSLSMVSFKNTFYIKENIGQRVKASSMKISKLMTYEAAGSFIAILVQGVIMLIGIGVIYGVNVNLKNVVPIIVIISVLSILAVSMGILAAAISKKKTSGESMCSIIVTIMVLISGTLMPNVDFLSDDRLSFLRLNPFVAISEEMNNLVTLNTSEHLYSAIGVGVIASLLVMTVAILILKRKVVK